MFSRTVRLFWVVVIVAMFVLSAGAPRGYGTRNNGNNGNNGNGNGNNGNGYSTEQSWVQE